MMKKSIQIFWIIRMKPRFSSDGSSYGSFDRAAGSFSLPVMMALKVEGDISSCIDESYYYLNRIFVHGIYVCY
jgi:hypothetical protein